MSGLKLGRAGNLALLVRLGSFDLGLGLDFVAEDLSFGALIEPLGLPRDLEVDASAEVRGRGGLKGFGAILAMVTIGWY